MLRCSLLGVFAATLMAWIGSPVVAEPLVVRQASDSGLPATVFYVTDRRDDQRKREGEHQHHEDHGHVDDHGQHGHQCERCDAHAGHADGCCHDARLVVRTSNARVCFTERGLHSFAALFTNATQKAMENVAVRALNATTVAPPCKDQGADDDDNDDD